MNRFLISVFPTALSGKGGILQEGFYNPQNFKHMDKQLARWIYWEENNEYYCADCMEKRLEEVNKNKEFSDSIDYENGQECGYYEDYADEDEEVTCRMCEAPLFSRVDNGMDGDETEEEA